MNTNDIMSQIEMNKATLFVTVAGENNHAN
jgi:hypothetical protein